MLLPAAATKKSSPPTNKKLVDDFVYETPEVSRSHQRRSNEDHLRLLIRLFTGVNIFPSNKTFERAVSLTLKEAVENNDPNIKEVKKLAAEALTLVNKNGVSDTFKQNTSVEPTQNENTPKTKKDDGVVQLITLGSIKKCRKKRDIFSALRVYLKKNPQDKLGLAIEAVRKSKISNGAKAKTLSMLNALKKAFEDVERCRHPELVEKIFKKYSSTGSASNNLPVSKGKKALNKHIRRKKRLEHRREARAY